MTAITGIRPSTRPASSGIPATLFPPEAIEELGVQQTPSAEFGVKGGAPINFDHESGSNSWHGDARWVRHTDFADASNWFNAGAGATPFATSSLAAPSADRS